METDPAHLVVEAVDENVRSSVVPGFMIEMAD
jgi:hypothetical protein